ncbi:MAG: RNA 2',3'-cyclic phosphodiesterase [bacterium]
MRKDCKNMRLFLASFVDFIKIDPKNSFYKIEDYFGCVIKPVKKENIHITWKFIGEIEESYISKIQTKINEIIDKSFKFQIEIKFQKIEIWPNTRYPRQIVLVGEDIDKKGSAFCRLLNKNLLKIGITEEQKNFNPHITLARFKKQEKIEKISYLLEELNFESVLLEFNKIDIVKSTLCQQGSIYEIIKSFS